MECINERWQQLAGQWNTYDGQNTIFKMSDIGYARRLSKLQELLNSVSYRYNTEFKVNHTYNSHILVLKSIVKVECAYKRDGTIIDLMFYREFPIEELDYILSRFNDWIRRTLWDIEKHELDEWLLINGERVFDPHENEIKVER